MVWMMEKDFQNKIIILFFIAVVSIGSISGVVGYVQGLEKGRKEVTNKALDLIPEMNETIHISRDEYGIHAVHEKNYSYYINWWTGKLYENLHPNNNQSYDVWIHFYANSTSAKVTQIGGYAVWHELLSLIHI